MKLFLAVLIVGFLLLISPARADQLSIYSDAALSNCTLVDTSPAVVNIYVGDTVYDVSGGTGVRFRVMASPGFTGTWLGESSPFVTIGNSRTDLSIGYSTCKEGKFLILTIQYQLIGTSACSALSIAPAIGFPVPLCTFCSFGEYPCHGFDSLHVNCPGPFDCNPVAVESSTWGRVKALYRD